MIEHVTHRTGIDGCLYLGVLVAGERHFISMHEAESMAAAVQHKLAELRKCGL